MNLLSIQGPHAPALYLDKHQEIDLEQQVSAIIHDRALVISSKFRTDILYYGNKDHVDTLLMCWFAKSGSQYNASKKSKFYRSDDELTTLTSFFYRLHLLNQFPQWHHAYYENFISKLIDNPKNDLCHKLFEILNILMENFDEHLLKVDKAALHHLIDRSVSLRKLAETNKLNIN